MTYMHLVLVVDIAGQVDQSGLNRIRENLNLRKQGRLTDDWDQTFGRRIIEQSDGQQVKITLFRNFDESWKIQVSATEGFDLTSGAVAALKDEVLAGITAAGFQASARPKPTFG